MHAKLQTEIGSKDISSVVPDSHNFNQPFFPQWTQMKEPLLGLYLGHRLKVIVFRMFEMQLSRG